MQVVHLTDSTGLSTADIAVSAGFNCYQLRLHTGEHSVDVFWSADDFPRGPGRPSGSGLPILCPFPGRIASGSFDWKGRTYDMERNDRRGNAIHGFVYTRPWRIREVTPDRVAAEFQASVDEPTLLTNWPSDFQITADYRLSADSLTTRYQILNPGNDQLPFGLGLHPYFRIPLANSKGTPTAQQCRVTVPARCHWTLENLIPTGESTTAGSTKELANGLVFDSMDFDDVFGDLNGQSDGRIVCRIDQVQPRTSLEIEFDSSFGTCVVYNPPHRRAVCIEPYTCIPNPFALQQRGIATGLDVLEPGESRQYTVIYRVH